MEADEEKGIDVAAEDGGTDEGEAASNRKCDGEG